MPRPQKYRDVARFLRSQGWEIRRSGKGSHEIWGDPTGSMSIVIPVHREVSAGVIGQLIRAFPDAPRSWR